MARVKKAAKVRTIKGYVVVSPRGRVFGDTFASTKDGAQIYFRSVYMEGGGLENMVNYGRVGYREIPATLTVKAQP